MKTNQEIANAIAITLIDISSHKAWLKNLNKKRGNKGFSYKDTVELTGSVEFHKQCIREYKHVLKVLQCYLKEKENR